MGGDCGGPERGEERGERRAESGERIIGEGEMMMWKQDPWLWWAGGGLDWGLGLEVRYNKKNKTIEAFIASLARQLLRLYHGMTTTLGSWIFYSPQRRTTLIVCASHHVPCDGYIDTTKVLSSTSFIDSWCGSRSL